MPPMRHRLCRCLPWLALLMACCGPALARAAAVASAPMTVVLDPGHTPAQPGALGVRGRHEILYNDAMVARIAIALRAVGVTVIVTRAPGQGVSLVDRAQRANRAQADLFLAIHHDSVQARYLVPITVDTRAAFQAIRPFAGYSLFVSTLNPRFADSYRFARLLGRAMLALGRAPTSHHTEKIPGENRAFLDPRLGIYRFDDLIVLKTTVVPAVLLEVGVIVDPADEAYVSSPDHQAAMTEAVVTAILAYAHGGG